MLQRFSLKRFLRTPQKNRAETEYEALLLLQRTGPMLLSKSGKNAFQNCCETGSLAFIIDWVKQYPSEANTALAIIRQGITEEALNLYEILKEQSWDEASTLLSIGPGNALLETELARYLKCKRLILIDIESSNGIYHGFEAQGSGYACLKKTEKNLRSKGFHGEIITCNPSMQPLPAIKFDIGISLLSMGFHYPASTYAKFIQENANKKALFIYDHRKNYDEPSLQLYKKFSDIVLEIDCGKKSRRLFLGLPKTA